MARLLGAIIRRLSYTRIASNDASEVLFDAHRAVTEFLDTYTSFSVCSSSHHFSAQLIATSHSQYSNSFIEKRWLPPSFELQTEALI